MVIKLIIALFVNAAIVEAREMTGRVLGLASQPLINAKVTLNDAFVATTDTTGAYAVNVEGTAYLGVDDELNYFKQIKVSSS